MLTESFVGAVKKRNGKPFKDVIQKEAYECLHFLKSHFGSWVREELEKNKGVYWGDQLGGYCCSSVVVALEWKDTK